MCLFTHGFTQELLVQGNDIGVLVRFPEILFSILRVKGFRTSLDTGGISVVKRLTSTADTSTGSGHNFDGVIGGFVGTMFVHQLAGGTQAMGTVKF